MLFFGDYILYLLLKYVRTCFILDSFDIGDFLDDVSRETLMKYIFLFLYH